jgi:uncharacterized repeat protein (TIGR03847 family)
VSESFDLTRAQRVTVGTVGEPGQRTFYLQVGQDERDVALKVEKQQVAALSQLLAELLADLPATGELPSGAALELREPIEPPWAVGSMEVAYDPSADRIVLLAEEATVAEDPDVEAATARIALTREQAAALAVRGRELVEAGRPPCPLCGYPLDPAGHACPRTNGHRPPTL